MKFRLSVLLVVVSLVAIARPFAAGPAVAGKYEGMVRGSSQGDMALTVTLAQEGEKISGNMAAGSFAFVVSGKVDGNTVTWSFSDGSISGEVNGTWADGAIKGEWSAAGEGGTFEVKRTAAH